jgi:hypothetical protein
MTYYKPYTSEWTRKRYLSEALQKYFENDVPSDVIADDIKSILNEWASVYRQKERKLQEVLDEFN